MIRVGAGASKALPDVLSRLGCSRPLLVTDSFIGSSGLMEPMQHALHDAGLRYAIFDGVVPDPTTQSLEAGLAMAMASECDVVVGFGGGSSIDSAKALACLAVNRRPLSSFKVPAVAPAGLPIVAVPSAHAGA